jgi:large subunit ribosomal protein L22
MPYRACGPVWQVIYSAAANAQNNLNIDKENLYISEAFADQGPVLRRFRPRAQGQGYEIRKPTCHISITVAVK